MAITETPAPVVVGELRHMDIDQLHEHPNNIRSDLGDLSDLVASVREKGILVPLMVTTTGTVVCGHRRLAAARILAAEQQLPGLVPCIIGEPNEAEQIECMFLENMHRNELTPLDEARGCQQLLELGEDVASIARNVQVREARIRERTALLQLPNRARKALEDGDITLGAAEQLLKLREHPAKIEEIVSWELGEPDEERHVHGPVATFWRVESVLQDIKRDEARAAARAKVEGDGLAVVDMPPYHPAEPKPHRIGSGYGELAVDAKSHKKLPCHAVAISDGGKLVTVCTKPTAHTKELEQKRASAAVAPDEPVARAVGVEDADEARWEFVRQLLARAPVVLTRALPLLAVITRDSYNDALLCKLLGLDVADERYSTKASEKVAEWLATDATIADGLPHLHEDRVVLAAAAIAWTSEYLLEDDTAMAFIVRALQQQGYEPNEAELELLAERTPADVAGWFS